MASTPESGLLSIFGNKKLLMTEQLSNYRVNDRPSFVLFLDLLRKDFLNNPTQWENNNLDLFLEALSAYANDIQGYYNNMGQSVNADVPSWQTFADIFKGAASYE
jgi:hypothetical protein